MKPRTIITYLTNGNPSGIKTVEFSNRLIKGVSIPRKDYKDSLLRDELKYSGIYILLGVDENDNDQAYIGQATILGKRLNDHYKDTKKDFWNNAVCFTYKDGSLTESDINFLERELIREAKQINRYNIVNGNGGNSGLIQEHRIPDMEEFIDDLKILILNLGYPILKEVVTKKELENEENVYYLNNRGSEAKGVYTEEGFLVFKGSYGPKELVKSAIERKSYSYRNRPKLIDKGIIEEKGDNIYFIKDYLFKSPSGASDTIVGRDTNGWLLWKDKKGNTLDDNIRK